MELDAVRGLAAVSAMGQHYHSLFYDLKVYRWYMLPFIASFPVILFSVMGGYVLSIPYWNGNAMPYPAYLGRRFLRIYVPYAAAVAVAVLVARHLMYAPLPLKPWFYETWHTPLTAHLIARQLLTMSTNAAINTAFWSLRYTVEFSIVLPFVCWALRRMRPSFGWIAAVLVLRAGMLLVGHAHVPALVEFGESLTYDSFFVFGVVLARQDKAVSVLYDKIPVILRVLLIVPVAVGYFSNRLTVIAFACCGIIVLARRSRIRRLLDTSILEYLGRISYSVYLLHGTVLWAVMILLYGKIPLLEIALLYCVVTLVVSHLFCISVEEPALRMGRWLTRKKRAPAAAGA